MCLGVWVYKCFGFFARYLNLVTLIVCIPIQRRVESMAIVTRSFSLYARQVFDNQKIAPLKTGMQIDDLTEFK